MRVRISRSARSEVTSYGVSCSPSSSQVPEQVLSWLLLAQEEVVEVEHKLTEAEHSRSQLRRFCTKFCTPAFLEAFVLTFLAGES